MFHKVREQTVCSELLINSSCDIRCKFLSLKSQATLAQLVERLIRNQQVAGSIPAGGSRFQKYYGLLWRSHR